MDELELLRRENAELKRVLSQSNGLIIKAGHGKTQIYNLAGQIVYVISDGELCPSGTYVQVSSETKPVGHPTKA